MKRPLKVAIWSIVGVALICLSLWFLLILRLSNNSGSEVEAREMTAQELMGRLTHLNPDIQVLAGFYASEYGGWHGDGGSVNIYIIDPSGMEELLAGLKRYHAEKRKEWPNDYNYQWSESTQADLSSLNHRVPERFLPKAGIYVIGRDQKKEHTISIGKTNGYVCFATSRS